MKFCDADTLKKVRVVWEFYVSQNHDKDSKAFEKFFKSGIDRAKQMKRKRDFSKNLTGLRSAGPTWAEILEDLPDLHNHFWKFGTTDMRARSPSLFWLFNPMFAKPNTSVTLHYALDPLMGFHLATAVVPLIKELHSPGSSDKIQKQERILSAARAEFSSWLESLRKHWGTLALSFFVGDAVRFSHELQSRWVSGGAETGNWYPSAREMLPLHLHNVDYVTIGVDLVSFGVIETSNLIDHVDAMNLLVATSPLFRGDQSLSLYTEVLVQKGDSTMEHVKAYRAATLRPFHSSSAYRLMSTGRTRPQHARPTRASWIRQTAGGVRSLANWSAGLHGSGS